MPFEIGREYSRLEISGGVNGGDLISFLPNLSGRVLCGCFDPLLNRRAPHEIDIGNLPKVVKAAKMLFARQNVIPVFLKRAVHRWECVGKYIATDYNEDSRDLYPIKKHRRIDAVAVLYLEHITLEEDTILDEPAVTLAAAIEGGALFVQHIRRERSRSLVEAKRRATIFEKGVLICEVCGLTESRLPPVLGEACFEVHHMLPLSQTGRVVTRLDDLALVCANCHRMIHRVSPENGIEEIRNEIVKCSAV